MFDPDPLTHGILNEHADEDLGPIPFLLKRGHQNIGRQHGDEGIALKKNEDMKEDQCYKKYFLPLDL